MTTPPPPSPRVPLAHALGGAAFARPYWRALLLALLCLVSYLALAPHPPRELNTGWDKLNHLLAFAMLAAVAGLAAVGTRTRIALALFAYGGAIEALQSLTPTHQAEWADLFVDGLGIGAGLLIAAAAAELARRLTAPDAAAR